MKSALEKLEDGTIKLSITIPYIEVKATWDEVVEQMVKSMQVSGFRKGKAPKKLVEENLKQDSVREEVLKKLLPKGYMEAVKEHTLRPIINPKIHIHPDNIKLTEKGVSEKHDWIFEAFTCETPPVDLDSYKDNVQKVTSKSKIVIPGKEPDPPKFEEIINVLIESIKVNIPKVLLDTETERMLAQTLDDIKKLGLSLDQYLASTQRTAEMLRSEYEKKAENELKLEFTLQKIAETEGITVDEKEIEEAILKAKDEKEKAHLENNRYLLAGILRQQKTLDFLKNL